MRKNFRPVARVLLIALAFTFSSLPSAQADETAPTPEPAQKLPNALPEKSPFGGTAIIEGVVVDENARPLSGMYVSPEMGWTVDVDERGKFIIDGLKDGVYWLLARPLNSSGKKRFNDGFAVALDEGQRVRGVRLVYVREDESTVSGRISDSQGRAIPGVRISAKCDDADAEGYAESDANGLYSIHLAKEKVCRLIVDHPDYAYMNSKRFMTGERDFDLVLYRRSSLEGRILDGSTNRPVTAFEISTFALSEEGGSNPQTPYVAFEDAGGRFQLNSLDSGRVYARVRAPGFAPNFTTIPDLREGTVMRDLDIRLDQGATIAGRVIGGDGAPVAGARIILNWATYSGAEGGTVTGEDGLFELSLLNPNLNQFQIEHDDYATQIVSFELASGQTTQVTVAMAGFGTLEGMVFANGRPYSGRKVYLQSGLLDFKSQETDKKGFFRITEIPEGSYDVYANVGGPDYNLPVKQSVTLRRGEVTSVRFDAVLGTGRIEGWLTREGAPVKHGRVVARLLNVPKEESFQVESRGKPDGSFTLGGLFPGEYELTVIASEHMLPVHATIEDGESVWLDIEIDPE